MKINQPMRKGHLWFWSAARAARASWRRCVTSPTSPAKVWRVDTQIEIDKGDLMVVDGDVMVVDGAFMVIIR